MQATEKILVMYLEDATAIMERFTVDIEFLQGRSDIDEETEALLHDALSYIREISADISAELDGGRDSAAIHNHVRDLRIAAGISTVLADAYRERDAR